MSPALMRWGGLVLIALGLVLLGEQVMRWRSGFDPAFLRLLAGSGLTGLGFAGWDMARLRKLGRSLRGEVYFAYGMLTLAFGGAFLTFALAHVRADPRLHILLVFCGAFLAVAAGLYFMGGGFGRPRLTTAPAPLPELPDGVLMQEQARVPHRFWPWVMTAVFGFVLTLPALDGGYIIALIGLSLLSIAVWRLFVRWRGRRRMTRYGLSAMIPNRPPKTSEELSLRLLIPAPPPPGPANARLRVRECKKTRPAWMRFSKDNQTLLRVFTLHEAEVVVEIPASAPAEVDITLPTAANLPPARHRGDEWVRWIVTIEAADPPFGYGAEFRIPVQS